MELYKQLANFFTGVRLIKCGQSREHFSKLINLPSHRIIRLENGAAKPTLEDIGVYTKYLGITVGDAFCSIEDENHALHIYVQTGEAHHTQRRDKSVARAFGMLKKLTAEEKSAVLKVLNRG